MPYFGEPVGRVKIQTTSKNSHRYYTTKRLIRDLLSNTPNCYVRGGELREYFIYGGMRDRSMQNGTKLAREIQLTDSPRLRRIIVLVYTQEVISTTFSEGNN